METILQDLRYGLRMLRKNLGFTLTAIVTLALGIGANTAIFSVVDFILLRPLPVEKPAQIHYLAFRQKGDWEKVFSYPEFSEIRAQTGAIFTDTAAVRPYSMNGLRINSKNETIWTSYVSGNYFGLLGIQPALGRLIQPSEGKVTGADPVVVLSYAFWKTHLNGDPNVVGTHASVNGRPVTVVGIAPEGFRGVSSLIDTQAYLPLGMTAVEGQKNDLFSDRKSHELFLVSRLKPEVSLSQAQSALDVVAPRLSQLDPENDAGLILHAFHLDALGTIVDSSDPLPMVAALFLILAGLVLTLACLNVANLFLVRATARVREMAVRAALGAARWRLIRQLLTESLTLALLGCSLGILLGMLASRALSSVPLGTTIPFTFDFAFDWRVFAYAFAAAVFCTVVVGVAPALRVSRLNLTETLRENTRTVAGGRQRLRSVLAMTQMAGSLTLLIVAVLFVRSLLNVQRSDLGFDPAHLLNVTVQPRQAGFDEKQEQVFYRQLLERVRALPGVESASLAGSVPFGYNSFAAELEVEGNSLAPGQPRPVAGVNPVSPGYFETMRIPLLRGRAFNDSDDNNSLQVTVVNEAMVKHFWPKDDPIGKKITLWRHSRSTVAQVVGIVSNSKTGDLSGPIGDYVYAPMAQNYESVEVLQVRTAGSPETISHDVVAVVHSLAPALPIMEAQNMTVALATLNGLLVFQLGAASAGCLGGLGLALAIVGVYGVLSYISAQRTHEIGIRMALGAQRGEVLKMILRGGVTMVVPGLVLGILASVGLARLLSSLLVGVSATDPLTFAGVSLLLACIALATCYLPARRAAQVDPMVALRYE